MINTHYKHSSSDNFLKQLPEPLEEAKCFIEDKLNKLTDRKKELLASNSISSTHRHLLELKRLLNKLDLKEFSELFPKDYDLYDAHRYSNYVTKLNQWKALERERFKDDLLDVVNHIALYQLLYHAKHYTGQSDQVVSSLLNTLDSLYAVTDKQHRLLNGFEKRIEAVKSEYQNLINRLDEFEKSIKTINSEHKQFFDRFDGIEENINSVDARLANLTNRFDGIEENINSVNSGLTNQANRLYRFEESVEQLHAKFDKMESKIRKKVTFVENYSSYLESYKKKKEAFTYLLFVVIIGLAITVFYSGRYSIEYSLNELEERIAKLDEKTARIVVSKLSDKPTIPVSNPPYEPPVISKPPDESPGVSNPPYEPPPVVSKPPYEPRQVVSKPREPSIDDVLKRLIFLEKRLEEEEKYQDDIIEHTIEKLGELDEEQQIEY